MLISQEQLEGIVAMGYRLYEAGELDKAAIAFQGLTVVARDSYYGYAGLGAVALAKNPPDLDGALSSLTMAAELNPASATVHANLGEALLRKRLFDQSAAEFQKALDLDPEKKDPGANRARAIIEGLRIMTTELRKMAEPQTAVTPA